MTNFKNGTIYVGVTNNLIRRVWEHKNDINDGFTNKYSLHLLVYYEFFETMEQAIVREKQIKAGSRKKKLILIEKMNKEWQDLYNSL